jgi:hypothetical protein
MPGMAELGAKDGRWTFDGEIVRIVPGHDRGVHKLRQTLGERAVPLAAIAGIAYEPGKKGGRLKLRLRDGADPLVQATGGNLVAAADPYCLAVPVEFTGTAEYFADELRNALLLEQVPEGPAERYLVPGPAVPLSCNGTDGSATFDGEAVRLSWNWVTEESKKSAGSRSLNLSEIEAVEWQVGSGFSDGCLRFRARGATTGLAPKHDPHSLTLWDTQKQVAGSALLAAAVVARLPHPADRDTGTPALEQSTTPPLALSKDPAPADLAPPSGEEHDALLRRLRELAALRTEGVLSESEFEDAKRAVLRRF